MRTLLAELEDRTKPLAGHSFIVFHDAYQYFERRFGLEATGSVTVSPEVAPSARRLSALRRKISELKAVCVFSEPQFEPRLVATITEKTAARRGVLDPLGVSIPAGPAHYPTLLRNLATDLEACLKG
jgi:zinc transport system substrate-binding protein